MNNLLDIFSWMKISEFFVVSWSIVLPDGSSYASNTTGYLDHLVDYYKKRLIDDIQGKLPPIGQDESLIEDVETKLAPNDQPEKNETTVKLIRVPKGYKDSNSTAWDYDSAKRLLDILLSTPSVNKTLLVSLLGRSEVSDTALNSSDLMPNTRRIFMSKKESYKQFPTKTNGLYSMNVYYDDDYVEKETGVVKKDESNGIKISKFQSDFDNIIEISNPVESRLPGHHVSIEVLRQVLEARAMAARVMPDQKKRWWGFDLKNQEWLPPEKDPLEKLEEEQWEQEEKALEDGKIEGDPTFDLAADAIADGANPAAKIAGRQAAVYPPGADLTK